jgi:phosphonate transport system permease protein
MSDRSEDETEPATDGGQATPEDATNPVESQFERIRQRRRFRIAGRIVIVAFVAFIFLQALSAVQLIDSNYTWDFFFESLQDFFPVTQVGGVPVIDLGAYWSFIAEEKLLFNGEELDALLTNPISFLFSGIGIFAIFGEAGITLAMGIAGTIIGFPLALMFGVLGSERVTPFPFNFIFRGTMSLIRAIPALVWMLIFIGLAGLSPAAATFAIAVDTIGNLGRLFVDELEEISDGPIEAMETTGASKPQVITFGMLSQVRTAFIAWTLYILEINVRIAVTVGVFGAGGLGDIVQNQQELFKFTNMMAALLCIFILIISVELFSQRLRSRLRSDQEKRSIAELIFGFPNRMARSVFK